MIRLGTVGLGGLGLPCLLRAAQPPASRAPAKSCILLYLWGGPPQHDMWDMKPTAPEGIRSHFQPINTVTPGIQICDQMPRVARVTDKMAIIRSYTHPSNAHEVGVYHTLTGKINNTLAVPRNMRNRNDFPNTGAVVSYFSPPSAMPASVTIPRPIGHDGVIYTGTYAGFLAHSTTRSNLNRLAKSTRHRRTVWRCSTGMDATRLQARFGLLKVLEAYDRVAQRQGELAGAPGLGQFRDQAFRMLTSPEARSAFDLEREQRRICANATAATSTARASCSRGGWSRPECGW